MGNFKRGGLAIAAALTLAAPASASGAADLKVVAPASATAGDSLRVVVTALDGRGDRDPGYRGRVALTANDPQASLPAAYRFTAADSGRHAFRATLITKQRTTLRAKDVARPTVKGSDVVAVRAAALDSLVVSPAASQLAPFVPPAADEDAVHADYFFTINRVAQYTAEGFDQYGNSRGDLSGQASWDVDGGGCGGGNVCHLDAPGSGTVTATIGAVTGTAAITAVGYDQGWGMYCLGENYDVDDTVVNGCEEAQDNPGRTMIADANYLGSFTCDNVASAQSFGGEINSDTRTHINPIVSGFEFGDGSAPDYNSLYAAGGACGNDLSLTITTTGGTTNTCYRLTVFTEPGVYTADVSGSGTATITQGIGAYRDDETISFKVAKTCPLPLTESVDYTITGHL